MGYENKIFPNIELKESNAIEKENLQIQAYGKRLIKDQTVPEYLLEFLLVFLGECDEKIGFDKNQEDSNKYVSYTTNPNIALKRFIFFENSKLENRFQIDDKAYKKLNELLKEKTCPNSNFSNEDIIRILQELYYGFSAVTKNRGWFAQSLMPICKETIFPEAMGKKTKRKNLDFDDLKLEIDTYFEYKEHNFMARGGEVYYLHLLQGFRKAPEYRENIQKGLIRLVNTYPQFSAISNWIIGIWNKFLVQKSNESIEEVKKSLSQKMKCEWITEKYSRRSTYTLQELDNLLKCETCEFEKIDLLNTGIVVQILRMMVEAGTCICDNKEECNPAWVVHIPFIGDADKKIKKLAVSEYRAIEEKMEISISKMLQNKKEVENDLKLLNDGYDNSFKLLRKLGKDIGLIIPLKGDNMRFTINDSLVRFFVLALVEPNSKITLDTFLDKLYKHYGIIIGVREYHKYLNDNKLEQKADVSFLNYNLMEFQNMLRKNGFLRELSDATSIIENPYRKMEEI